MQPRSSAALLDAWERALQAPSGQRGSALLSGAGGASDEDVSRLTPGRRNAQLLELRASFFGPTPVAVVACGRCGERTELELNLSELLASTAAPSEDVLSVVKDGWAVRARLPDGRDLQASSGGAPAVEPRRRLLQRCVLSVTRDGVAAPVEETPDGVVDAISRRMAEADPCALIEIEVSCAGCGHTWLEALDVESFVWAEVQAWAGRLVNEVHRLAAAYGWSEAQILALTPLRRHLYLTLAAE